MATRREVNQRKAALKLALREAYQRGELSPGEPAPPVRQLAEEYSLSKDVAAMALRELAEEGLFYSVPRIGIFVGRPPSPATEFYLITVPHHTDFSEQEYLQHYHFQLMKMGFENRISHLGGACLAMPLPVVEKLHELGELPPICGIFEFVHIFNEKLLTQNGENIPRVRFYHHEEKPLWDTVSYDNVEGGKQATQHLLQLGHTKIAFLGVHTSNDEHEEFIWSAEREQGWREALNNRGLTTQGLLFKPSQVSDHERLHHGDLAHKLAPEILKRRDITAVVAANDFAARGLLDFAHEHGQAFEHCPSIVGFDDLPTDNGHIISSLRLPAEEIGRAAADLLWERHHGQLAGSSVHRRVPMRLLPRLTSRHNWSQTAGHVALTKTKEKSKTPVLAN